MTTPELTPGMVARMSPKERKRVALSMMVPLRCGGCHYLEDGTRVTMFGGKWLTDVEVEALRERIAARNRAALAALDAET